jgi:hypothetical protein
MCEAFAGAGVVILLRLCYIMAVLPRADGLRLTR